MLYRSKQITAIKKLVKVWPMYQNINQVNQVKSCGWHKKTWYLEQADTRFLYIWDTSFYFHFPESNLNNICPASPMFDTHKASDLAICTTGWWVGGHEWLSLQCQSHLDTANTNSQYSCPVNRQVNETRNQINKTPALHQCNTFGYNIL